MSEFVYWIRGGMLFARRIAFGIREITLRIRRISSAD